jgi:high-affinity Fe2+/Pb2+ permease
MYIDVSARKVAWWVRLLAVAFVLAATVATYFTVYKLIANGWQEDLHIVDLVLMACISALFGYVAVTGRAPFKWFRIVVPFKRK